MSGSSYPKRDVELTLQWAESKFDPSGAFGSREVAANDKILMRIVLVVLGCSPVIFH